VFVQVDKHEDERKSYDLAVDAKQFDRATSIKPCSMLRPHMRIFYLSWMSGIMGFVGWYAIPPLMPVIKTQLGLTEGQVLNSDIASTASTIFSRIASGPLLDRFGPQAVQSAVLWFGAIPIICAAFVNSATSLLIVRFFIGLVGCVFVSGQYWTTITFARNVAGTANAITGGLGLSGIGFAFLVLPFVYEAITSGGHVSEDLGWRITIALPAVLMVIMGTVICFAVDSCPTGDFQELMNTKRQAEAAIRGSADVQPPKRPSLIESFKLVLSDTNVLIMIAQYAACFGTELQLNNMGALYFYKEFTKKGCTDRTLCPLLSKTSAATVASSFGLMNLVARALGGLTSDAVNRRLGMRGRQCAQCLLLCILGALVMALSRSYSLGLCVTLYVLVAVAAQASGGSTYSIVPYLNEQHTGTVNGLVGAGGNMGGALFGVIFRVTGSYHTGLFYMSIFIFCCALLTPLLRLSHLHHQGDATAIIGDHSQHGPGANASLKPYLDDEPLELVAPTEAPGYRAPH
jgi:NNP family nitrate/nitrite transporter-like MFS transporter